MGTRPGIGSVREAGHCSSVPYIRVGVPSDPGGFDVRSIIGAGFAIRSMIGGLNDRSITGTTGSGLTGRVSTGWGTGTGAVISGTGAAGNASPVAGSAGGSTR